MATKVKPISTLLNVLGRKRRKYVAQRTRWEVVPSERKVLAEFIENENVEYPDQNALGPVEYMVEEIIHGANVENVNSSPEDPTMKRQEHNVDHNDNFEIKPAYAHGFVFVNAPPELSSSLDANGHIGRPPLHVNHPPVHGQCCMCPCHQVTRGEPQILGPSYCTEYPPVGGTIHVVCLPPPALPPLPPAPPPQQQGWAWGGSVLR